MDDELPSKMTHGELVDLHMRLRILQTRLKEMKYYSKLLSEEVESILQNIDSKIIDD